MYRLLDADYLYHRPGVAYRLRMHVDVGMAAAYPCIVQLKDRVTVWLHCPTSCMLLKTLCIHYGLKLYSTVFQFQPYWTQVWLELIRGGTAGIHMCLIIEEHGNTAGIYNILYCLARMLYHHWDSRDFAY